MKLAVAGKGGVGKTTLVALLAREAVTRGYRVIAVDADPDANLAMTLGIHTPIVTLAEAHDLIKERVGAEGLVKLNPTVDDIPDRYSVEQDGIRLLVLGGVRQGGGGCACPANTLLHSLLRHLFLRQGEVVLVDMEAGIEHLGRGTVQGVDSLVVVVEGDRRSLETAARIIHLAHEIGLDRILAVGNKIRQPEEEALIREGLPDGIPLLSMLPYVEELRATGVSGSIRKGSSLSAVHDLFTLLEGQLGSGTVSSEPRVLF